MKHQIKTAPDYLTGQLRHAAHLLGCSTGTLTRVCIAAHLSKLLTVEQAAECASRYPCPVDDVPPVDDAYERELRRMLDERMEKDAPEFLE